MKNLPPGSRPPQDDAGHPRVLIVVVTKIKADDPASLLLRMQFGGWPAERLAQIHSGQTAGQGEFCSRYYQIGASDRLWGRLFMRLRGGVAGMVAMEAPGDQTQAQPAPGADGRLRCLWARARQAAGRLLIHSGLWELIFHIRVSPQMRAFVSDFRPDVIYCTGYHLGFVSLPLLIAREFDLPICFQTFEDWPEYGSRHSPIGWLMRRRSAELIRKARVRLVLGEKMKAAYEERYGVPVVVSHHLDDPARFMGPPPQRETDVKRIVFTGTLVLNRPEAMEDLLQAVRRLGDPRINIEVYCPGVPREVASALRSASELRFLPLPSHDQLPAILRAADVLFLPEAFSVGEDRLGLALSTKCHLYMLAGRPILAYGPAYAGSMQYARDGGWALVVGRRDIDLLAEALHRLLNDSSLMQRLAAKGQRCLADNHDLSAGRERFERLIAEAADPRKDVSDA